MAVSDPHVVEKEKNNPHILAHYTVQIGVTNDCITNSIDCWQVDFATDEKAPSGVREQKYRVLVSKQDGSIKAISRLSGADLGSPEVIEVEGVTVLQNAPYGFPMEIIQRKMSKNDEKVASSVRLSTVITNKPNETTKEFELKIKQDNMTVSTIRQKWTSGAKWWTEYEKRSDGYLELKARLRNK